MYVLADGATAPVEPVQVVASLLGSTAPRLVRVVVDGLPFGVAATISAVTAAGARRVIPGGVVTSSGGQVVRVDNRAPLNVPVRYEVAVGGAVYASDEVTVTYPGKYLIQSYDGRTVVDFWLLEDGLPREYVVRSTAFDVPGRSRPPVHFAPGGAGGGSFAIRTNREGTRRLESVLASGQPVVLRTSGDFRDLAPVETLMLASAQNRLSRFPAMDSQRKDREWVISYLLVDDPEPSTLVAAYTWADVEAALLGRTWSEVEAMFFGLSWSEFELTDWSQYA